MTATDQISILYVDDEQINLFLFQSLFKEEFEVTAVDSGVRALAELEKVDGKFDVVISDMNMPEMNGLEFINLANETYENLVFFILTGYDINEDIQNALDKNLVHKFFSKPFEFEDIAAEIRKVVGA